MERKLLKLEKPCLEKWENMKLNESGRFCSLCSKNVIDFTKLNQFEISKIMENENSRFCARITQKQLNLPLLNVNIKENNSRPFPNITASLIFASTIVVSYPIQAKNELMQTEIFQIENTTLNKLKNNTESKPNLPKPNDFTFFKGKVNSVEDGIPIKNAKIIFVTIKKQFITYTLNDGTFSLKIPTEFIDEDNVIRVEYDEVKLKKKSMDNLGFETADYILTKKDLKSLYKIIAYEAEIYFGGISRYSEYERMPIVINNGEEIKYNDFIKARSTEIKEFYYFGSDTAIALYGEKAKYGLYILK